MLFKVQDVYQKLQDADTDNIFTWRVDHLEEGKFRILGTVNIENDQYACAYIIDDNSQSNLNFDDVIQGAYEHFRDKYHRMVDKPPMTKYN